MLWHLQTHWLTFSQINFSSTGRLFEREKFVNVSKQRNSLTLIENDSQFDREILSVWQRNTLSLTEKYYQFDKEILSVWQKYYQFDREILSVWQRNIISLTEKYSQFNREILSVWQRNIISLPKKYYQFDREIISYVSKDRYFSPSTGKYLNRRCLMLSRFCIFVRQVFFVCRVPVNSKQSDGRWKMVDEISNY